MESVTVTGVVEAPGENRVPSCWTAAAPHCRAVAKAWVRPCRQLRYPASMASPAPTVLTTFWTGAWPQRAPSASTRTAPSPPRLASTGRAPGLVAGDRHAVAAAQVDQLAIPPGRNTGSQAAPAHQPGCCAQLSGDRG